MRKIVLNNRLISKTSIAMLFVFVAVFVSCDFIDELPEENSIADETPPTAFFTFTSGVAIETFTQVAFANQSNNATNYNWDFGDGNTSTEIDPKNTYPGEGSYTVTLTIIDALNQTSTYSETIELIEPEEPEAILPTILEAGFEDNSLPDGTGDGRDSWRISGGKIFGITSSPVRTGSQGAKFNTTDADARVAYQELIVTPNTDYIISIYYTMKTSPVGGELRLAILGNAISDASEAEAAIIASATGNNQTSSSTYERLTLSFNSGATDTIAIWIDSNNIAEARVDDVSIELAN